MSLPEFPDVQLVHGSPSDEDEYVVSLGDALAPLITLTILADFFRTHPSARRILCERIFGRWIPSGI